MVDYHQKFHSIAVRTNYGEFNLRCKGEKVWNSTEEESKQEINFKVFKTQLKTELLKFYI